MYIPQINDRLAPGLPPTALWSPGAHRDSESLLALPVQEIAGTITAPGSHVATRRSLTSTLSLLQKRMTQQQMDTTIGIVVGVLVGVFILASCGFLYVYRTSVRFRKQGRRKSHRHSHGHKSSSSKSSKSSKSSDGGGGGDGGGAPDPPAA
ncbi:hypothetical protein BX600DRAFT_510573 [Xylariales sp. PMI_506]|nr:hypothetical protein BX600DRAFT_510573 [Xylariales sp. PMI_506]